MGMANHDVRDLFRLHPGKFHRFVGANVFSCSEFLRESIAVVAAVEENVAAVAADQPHNHGQLHFLVRSAHNEIGGVVLSRSIANRLDGIFRRRRRCNSRAGHNKKNDGEQKMFHERTSKNKRAESDPSDGAPEPKAIANFVAPPSLL